MSDEHASLEQAKVNWQLYYTLTQELLKFISRADIDEFLDLVRQRNIVVDRMKALPETEIYRQTEECRKLVEKSARALCCGIGPILARNISTFLPVSFLNACVSKRSFSKRSVQRCA